MIRTLILLMVVALQVWADDFTAVESDAEHWYRTNYATLWQKADRIDLDKVRSHYAKGYRLHAQDGGFSVAKNSEEEWLEALKYFGDSWVGSDLQHAEVTAFSSNAVAIRSEWVNRNSDGTTSPNCANYVAARSEEAGWQFLDLFVVTCSP